jgi:hypothetical protein
VYDAMSCSNEYGLFFLLLLLHLHNRR